MLTAEYTEDLWFMLRAAKRHNNPMAKVLDRVISGCSTAQDRHNVAQMVRDERISMECRGFDASYDIGLEAAIRAL